MNRFVFGAVVASAALFVLGAQQSTIDIGRVEKSGALPAIAIPDLRGDGQAQGFMGVVQLDPVGRRLDGRRFEA